MKPISVLQKTGAGFLVGTLDISAACIQFYAKTGKNPQGVLRFIASGVFGKEAAANGIGMVFWGLLFHYIFAMGFTFCFFWIIGKLKKLLKYPSFTGVLYACLMWLFMQLVVLPLSNTAPVTLNAKNALIAISILAVCIGLPLAYLARNWYSTDKTEE